MNGEQPLNDDAGAMNRNKPKVDKLFLAALELPAEQRQAYLDEACGEDGNLRRKLERLLEAKSRVGSFLDSPAQELAITMDDPLAQPPDRQIGPYKLLQEIGEGGMGVVYMAEQKQPVRRRVALKIIKPGMDSRKVIARFEAERQALAMMDHPNIATVLDAGATETGRPYFVMELVHGQRITDYCDANHLSLTERLELFVPVCQAIQHAHQKGIIHRDIKPSNVLVAEYDGRPEPKIIDFGVAKALNQPLTEKTMFTQFGQVLGTVEYMSPEQARVNQLDVDTRSDIYSLGVLLYELLTGATPFDPRRLQSAALDELMRIIRDEDPPRPSTRLSSIETLPSVAANRNIEPRKLSLLLRGELDWIVMKAMEKDRSRRYATAMSLAEDVQHVVDGEPVSACPPSPRYRIRKWVRRNKVAFTTSSLVVLALVAGITGTGWQAIRATRSEAESLEYLAGEQAARRAASASESLAKRRLFDSLLDQARARRWNGKPGQRLQAITAITSAASMMESLEVDENTRMELRDEAIAALASFDLLQVKRMRARQDSESNVAMSPDFSLVAIEYRHGNAPSVKVCRLDDLTNPLLSIPSDSGQGVFCVFSPDSRFLALRQFEARAIEVWNVFSRKKILTVATGNHLGKGFDFCPDSQRLVAGNGSGKLSFYDLQSGLKISQIDTKPAAVRVVRFGPKGSRVAVAHQDSDTIEVYDLDSRERQFEHPVSRENVSMLTWHPDGHRIGVGCWQSIDILNLDGNSIRLESIPGHDSQVNNLWFHPTSPFVLSTSWDGRTRVFNLSTRKQVLEVLGSLDGVCKDNQRIAVSLGLDVFIWEMVVPEACRWIGSGSVFGISVGRDEQLVALATASGLELWDLAFERHVGRIPLKDTFDVLLGPGNDELFTCGPSSGLLRWPLALDLNNNRLKAGPPSVWVQDLSEPHDFRSSHSGSTTIISHLKDGLRYPVATLLNEDESGKTRHKLTRPFLWYIDASPDGRLVAAGSKWGKGVTVWDAKTARVIKEYSTPGSTVVQFSPDSQVLVCNSGGSVDFLDTSSWAARFTFPASASAGSATAFSPDGETVAIARRGEGLLLFDLQNNISLATLRSDASLSAIDQAVFTPDGNKLLLSAGERGIRVWDLLELRQRLRGLQLDWSDLPVPKISRDPSLVPLEGIDVDFGSFEFGESARNDDR